MPRPLRMLCLPAVLVLIAVPAFGGTITLQSGNGPVGGTDSRVTMLVGPANGGFGVVFDSSHFAAALSGPPAFVSPANGAWKAHLDPDPSAEWLTTRFISGPGVWSDTALFAISFDLGAAPIQSASLDFHFLVDNDLGDAFNEGLFLNGLPIPGTRLTGQSTSHFQADHAFIDLDLSSLVHAGTNTLFVYQFDRDGPSGLQFSATVRYQAVPLPAAAWMALGLLLALGAARAHVRAARRSARV